MHDLTSLAFVGRGMAGIVFDILKSMTTPNQQQILKVSTNLFIRDLSARHQLPDRSL